MRFFAAVVATAVAFDPSEALWKKFKQEYKKEYKHDEEAHRVKVFRENVAQITKRNAEQSAYKLEINEFADLTQEEFAAQRLGVKMPAKKEKLSMGTHEYSGNALPASVDWTTKGAVTPVKNQGQCGSCWSFSTTGALEGANFIATGKLVSLSEEEFVSCDKVDQGCNGGLMDNAFKYAESNAICTEASYPYTATGGVCKSSSCTVGLAKGAVTGFKDVAQNEQALMEAVAQQPVAIAIEADQMAFQFYTGGVLTGACGTNLDHGVLAVGYGTENGQDYWLVKNSWGASWGDKGYIKIERGAKQQGGECGILMSASYPVIAKSEEAAPANGHYEKPPCSSDEAEAQLTGSSGVLCAPKCDASGSCPTDFPSGVTATPLCALQDQSGNKYCALMCTSDAQCDTAGGSTCAMVAGSEGVCTYPPTLDAGAMTLSHVRATAPSGQYCGDVAGIAKAKLNIDDGTHVDVDVTVFGVGISCKSEEVALDAQGNVKVVNIEQQGDCAHDALAKFGMSPDSLQITYSASADTVSVSVQGTQLSLTHAGCSSEEAIMI